jgi:hypothetical protein
MPTNQTRLTDAIQAALEAQVGNQTDAGAARQQLATAIASAVLVEIKAAQIVYEGGLIDGTGKPVSGVFTNSIT